MYDMKRFFDAIRGPLFRGRMTQAQANGVEALFTAAPDNFRPDYLAYCLATAYWETAKTMQPIEEYGKGKTKSYGKPNGPYGLCYYGRGYVQLTHYDNYVKATQELHKKGILSPTVDLARNPEKALQPDIAAAIMFEGMVDGWFTTRKLSQYFGASKSDPEGARAIINGVDKKSTIAAIYRVFYSALVASIITAPVVVTPVGPVAADPPAPTNKKDEKALAQVHADIAADAKDPHTPPPLIPVLPTPPEVARPPVASAAAPRGGFFSRLVQAFRKG